MKRQPSVPHVRAWFRQRAFLTRILFSTLLACLIPFSIVSTIFIQDKSSEVENAARAQLATMADSVAAQADGWVKTYQQVANKLQVSGCFIPAQLAKSVTNRTDAIALLSNMRLMLDSAAAFGVYLPGEDESVYSPSGKFYPTIYATEVLHANADRFLTALNASAEARFVACGALGDFSLYACPVRIGSSSNVSFICFFALTEASVAQALANVLSDSCMLAALVDAEERVIYQNKDCPFDVDAYRTSGEAAAEVLVRTSKSAGGLSVVCYRDKSLYQQSMSELSAYTTAIVTGNLLLCVVLIVLAALVNYQSVRHLFRHIMTSTNLPYAADSEIGYIASAFEAQLDEKERLQQLLLEQQNLLLDQTYERLLSGKPAPEELLARLRLSGRPLFVVCCLRSQVRSLNTLILQNQPDAPVYAIEILPSDALTFICRPRSEEAEEVERLLALVRSYLNDENACVGISPVYPDIADCSEAYAQASAALLQSAGREGETGGTAERGATDETGAMNETYARVLQFINENYTDPMLDIDAVANHMGVSAYSATKVLKQMFGVSFRRYLHERRIAYGKELLLESEATVADISQRAGFLSPSYFIRIFREIEGMTPAAYRKARGR